MLENLSPYRVGTHQHAPEIEQALGFPVCFVPHLLPVRRGLLVTCYVQPLGDLRALLEDAYADAPAVRVLDEGVTPELSRVQHTDAAEIALYEDRATGRAVVVCVIDNLGKGAAGNAVQNANVALGLDETAGLRLTGVLGMSVTAARDSRRAASPRGSASSGPTLLSWRAKASASAPGCSRRTASRRRRSSSARSTSRSPIRRPW